MRVVQVIPVLYMGGLERVATALTLGLAGRVDDVLVCSAGGSPFEEALRSAGVPVEYIPRPRPRPAQLTRAALALTRVLRRERPDILHAHNPAAGAAAALARSLARLPGTAVVTTYHGVVPDRLGRAAQALTLSSDLVVGVGPSATRALCQLGLPASRSATVYNAVTAKTIRPASEVRRELGVDGAELVVTVGRYVAEKNHALLLEAVALLAPRRPALRALLVGVGPLEEQLRRRARELGLEEIAILTGERRDAVDITAAADVFALSSSSEGLPLALLEAMALGRPVVSTTVGGVSDAVRDGVSGLLVRPGDPAALAAALERLLDDGDLRRRLAADARAFVDRVCSEEAMVERYLALYSAVVARGRSLPIALRAGASLSK